MSDRPIRVPESYPLVQDPPFSLKGARTLVLALPASRSHLEALCHRTFHWSAPEVRVEPLGQTVLLVLTDVREARARDPLHGFFRYREATFFVPVRGERFGVPFAALHVPFIYPSEGLAVAAGREIYGLPKKPASVSMPSLERLFDGSEAISVHALAAERLDGSAWQDRELLRITSQPQGLVPQVADALLDAIDLAFGGIPGPLAGVGHLLEQRLVQLKQVPDVRTHGTPPRVLYRAVTEVKAPVRALSNVRIAEPAKVRVEIAALASEPIREVLGLPAVSVPSLAASLDMDFLFEEGTTWLERPVQPSAPAQKTRVLVLGGGMGGLAAAHALTDTDARRARFEVTVLSMGHYLGGKGSNLRHPDANLGRRVEEHGIHVFFGFYHNALRLLRSLYAEANRASTDEPSTFDEAFRPEWRVTFHDGSAQCEVTFPRTPATYGAGPQRLEDQLELLLELVRSIGGFAPGSGIALMIASLVARGFGLNVGNRLAAEVIAFAITLVRGVTEDVVLGGKGWDVLDAQDFRAWMHSHRIPGFPDLRQTAIMQVPYDGVFAYEGPDQSTPVLSAGVAARGLLKLVADYERAPYHTMMAGMGEVVFMPMLEVLRARGVRIELFTKVKELRMSGARVGEIVLARQALVTAGQHAYDPVEVVQGVKTWRRDPDASQLSASAIAGKDPMSDAVPDQVGPDVVLTDGLDYDWVICALPAPVTARVLRNHGAMPVLADIEKIPTVATLHLQAWLKDPLFALGWKGQSRVLGGFPQPLNSMLTQDEVMAVEP
ncbi:MAG: NAD(P)-binding protein, partial [Deltaproteobacteria bacterium]